jgi:hypothetical protein
MEILAPISYGELIDKLTILEIKLGEITDSEKRANVQKEYDLLCEIYANVPDSEELAILKSQLFSINKKIWDSEDHIRTHWNNDPEFLRGTRESHYLNDERAKIKRQINVVSGSSLIEEKSHPKYEHKP